MLTATDSAVNGGGDDDGFRIKIWDKNSDQILYDNLAGEDEFSHNTQPIGGGSIVIHKAKNKK